MQQKRGLPLRWEVHHFKHLHHSYNRIHSIGGLGGIFDNAASFSEGSLLVDILVIMPRWDAIMHCVSWLRSAVIYGQPALCYRTTAWDGWEWIWSSGKVAEKCWWQFKFEKYSLCCAVLIQWAMWSASLMRTQRTSWGNQAHIRAYSLFRFSDCFWIVFWMTEIFHILLKKNFHLLNPRYDVSPQAVDTGFEFVKSNHTTKLLKHWNLKYQSRKIRGEMFDWGFLKIIQVAIAAARTNANSISSFVEL